MQWRSIVCVAAVLGSTMAYAADPTGATANFTLTQDTRIPGSNLKAGQYTIRIVDHLSDRLIVRVDSANGKTHTTFLGLQDAKGATGSPGVVNWSNDADRTAYLKGFQFPNTSSLVEFVYPKAEAVAIAKSNQSKVPAIDPASEGKPTDKNLSKDDMEVVTLWLLSSTTVGPNDQPAIQAQKYQQVASNEPPPPPAQQARRSRTSSYAPSAAAQSSGSGYAAASQSTPSEQATASSPTPRPRRHVVSALPHTGSNLPLIILLGGLSLVGAATLRVVRSASTDRG